MRKLAIHILSATALVTGTISHAADLDYGVLRGADEDVYVPPIDWSGVYVGGHGGWSTGNAQIGKDMQSYSTAALAGQGYRLITPTFGPVSTNIHETSYGGFAGYNLQLDDTIVGVEVDYTRATLRGRADDTTQVVSVVNGSLGTVARTSTTAITDYGTVRARAGYAFGSFMPFATAGLAVARLEETNTLGSIFGSNGAVVVASSPTRSSERYTFGFAVGAGIDFALTNNIVLRGEYQYVQLDDFRRSGVANKIEINTFRGGAAIKF